MNKLAKQIANEEGEKVRTPVWHLISTGSGDRCLLCTGEFIDYGACSEESVYEFKDVVRGGITCDACLSFIKKIKGVKL